MSTQREIVPGYRQDHLGRNYLIVLNLDDRGVVQPQEQMFVEPAPLSERTMRNLEPVTVESQGRHGTFYQSLACFQGITV